MPKPQSLHDQYTIQERLSNSKKKKSKSKTNYSLKVTLRYEVAKQLCVGSFWT